MTRWVTAAVMPLALGALLTSAEAQGKGQGGGRDDKPAKAAPAQARGGKAESRGQARSEAAAPRSQREQPARARGQARRDEAQPRGQSPAAADRGKAIERGNPEFDPGRMTGRENARDRANEGSEAGGLVAGPGGRGRGRLSRTITVTDLSPAVRVYATSNKPAERFLGRAVGIAALRGLSDEDFRLMRAGDRVHVMNRRGDLLLDLDDNRARDMGSWKVVTEDYREKEGAPSFCRSGAGHPVWGRQWCVEKGFGLGMDDDIRWGRATDLGDIILRPRTEADLRRDVLTRVLGDIVFNRLAGHAISLGYAEPLTGRWIGETTGPRVLLLTSGDRPVAEVVDVNRDERADVLLVALRPW